MRAALGSPVPRSARRALTPPAHTTEIVWDMFYFFRRGTARIRCEVRADSGGHGYELIVDRPDAMISVEHFVEPPDLNRRWREIERTLIREGWNGPRLRDN